MNCTDYRLSLDIFKTVSQTTLPVKQGDTAYKLCITITANGTPYRITEGCYAQFTAKKPDGNFINNKCTIENNTIYYQLTSQTTAAIGMVECEIVLYDANGEQLATPHFNILVDKKAYNGEEIKSSSEVNMLEDLIKESQEQIAEVEKKLANGELKGEQGIQGERGIQGEKGDTYTLTKEDKEEISNLTNSGAKEYAERTEQAALLASNAATIATNEAKKVEETSKSVDAHDKFLKDSMFDDIPQDISNAYQGERIVGGLKGTVGNTITINTSNGYQHAVYSVQAGDEYSLSTIATVSASYPHYAFVLDENDVVLSVGLASTGIAETIYDTVTIPDYGVKMYIMMAGTSTWRAEVIRTKRINTFEKAVKDIITQDGSTENDVIKIGKQLLDNKRSTIFNYNRNKKFLNFAWITDCHINEEIKDSPELNNIVLFSHLCKEKFLNFAVSGGDFYTSDETNFSEALGVIDNATQILGDVPIPMYFVKGNHDFNAKGDMEQRISRSQWTMLFQNNIDVVFNPNDLTGGYFYKDFENEKIRIIVTNCFDNNDDATTIESVTWNREQTRFIATEALNFMNKDNRSEWCVILLSHHMYHGDLEGASAIRWELYPILEAFQKGGNYSGANIGGIAINVDFSQQGAGNLICTLHGHEHLDSYNNDNGWNNIGTDAGRGGNYKGGANEFCFSVFTVDTENKMLYETRVGRGTDRKYSYGAESAIVD